MGGLQATVSIYRDELAIPYIQADNAADSYAALGFVHAQDRLWQMETMRRFIKGRLAEILGLPLVSSDRFMRLLGFSHLVKRQFKGLAPDTREALRAYAQGVNSWISSYQQALPPEFAILSLKPEPWLPEDSLLWGRLMALRLSGNWHDELLRTRMLESLSDQQILSFWYPDQATSDQASVDMGRDHQRLTLATEVLEEILALTPPLPSTPRGASNAWVVTGEHTESSRPILANDPHLGLNLPSMWYLAHMETPAYALTGATVPGVPFMVLGHNGRIAWGLTSTQSDQQDLFIERVSNDGQTYQAPDGNFVPFTLRQEAISVYGQADEVLTIRETGHGPVISDLAGGAASVTGDGTVLSLSATFLAPEDSTPDAMMGVNGAPDWSSFLEAVEKFQSPQVNMVYADTGGTIGFISPGKVPVRNDGRGRFPVPGWNTRYAWSGFIPFDDLPRSVNPLEGRIVSANNRIVSDDYPYFISDDWAPPYRAKRIFQLLNAFAPLSVSDMEDIQLDNVSEMARELLPYMTALAPRNPNAAEAISRLARWDGAMSRESVEPLIFYAWLRELNRAIYKDELGDLFPLAFGLRPKFIATVLRDEQHWCDDTTTTQDTETCEQVLEGALIRALSQLGTMGADGKPVRRWGEVHEAVFRHPFFSKLPVISEYWGERRVAVDGGNYTVNRAATRPANEDAPYEDIHGGGFRAIYDLADLSQSRFILSTGQSGNPLSAHYDDLLNKWADGEYVMIDAGKLAINTSGYDHLRLLVPGAEAPPPPTIVERLVPLSENIVHGVARFVRTWGGLVTGIFD
ncbi:MAG: penicillin acylase family protein [Rhodospirillales bacterium]|nr:penicillin acylase family protein [Rhodospirillales bacterium]MBT4041663.1 penicillin acylase family protein [Rhodospirillales bacterium]MBT4628114.1 penicillin acylase family protein [Rhodospirillales bacterium]MBT5350145.1 penicillin acylase family protein [Rhodospirillales bacterium]MBT5521011.1 penicillin acylase family protein [Rhodospirillales bacterium]